MTKEKKIKAEPIEKEAVKETPKHGTLIRYAVMGGIVILLNLFVLYAMNIIYPEPQYQNFCKVEQVKKMITSEDQCVAVGGQWSGNGMSESEPASYCNQDFTCSKNYDEASKLYQRNVFIVLVVVGSLLLAGSLFLSGSALIATSLSFAGILSFIIGSLGYWSNMNDILRVIILGLSLAVLLYLAWKKFED